MLNQTSSKKRNVWKYSLILPLLALFLFSFNTKEITVVKDAPQTEFTVKANSAKVELNDFTTHTVNQKENHNNPTDAIRPSEKKADKQKHEAVEKDNLLALNDASSKSLVNDVIVKITKDTTKEELDQIEKDMRAKGMSFSYSDVDYNSAKEITSIRIRYKDKNSGNSGSYHVNGDDDEPIKPIYIYKTDNGGIGLGTSPDGREHSEKMETHKAKMKEHKERMYEHKKKMKEHNAKIKEEHEERMEEHRVRMEEHKARIEEEHEVHKEEMKERQEKLHEKHEVRKAKMKERQEKMHEAQEERMEAHRSRMEERKARRHEEHEKRTMAYDDESFEKAYIIEATTSDAMLNSFKQKLAAEGIDFKFSGIKRNKNGEITRIKLRLDDNNGSKSSSAYDTSPGTIPTIMLGKKTKGGAAIMTKKQ